MKDQKDYWEGKILAWERSAYAGDGGAARSLLERIATRFRGRLRQRLAAAEDLVKAHIEGKSVGDLGCGSGQFLTRLLRYRPKRLVGVDIAAPAIAVARARASELGLSAVLDFVVADVRREDAVLAELDVVTAIGFLDYLQAEEIHALLARLAGKRFLLSFPERRLSLRRLLHATYVRLAGCPGSYRYSRAEMDALMARAGVSEWWYYDRDQIRFVTNLRRG